MTILLACRCGKKMKARDELAGKKVKCPGCGTALTVRSEDEGDLAESVQPAESIQGKSSSGSPAKASPRGQGGPPPLPPALPPTPRKRSRQAEEFDDDDADDGEQLPPKKRKRISRKSGAREEDGDFAPLSTEEFPPDYLCKAGFKKRLLVLESDGILFEDGLDGKDLKRARRDLEDGTPAEDVLGEAAVRIDFAVVTRFHSNLHHPNLYVDWKKGEEKETLDLQFEDAAERDLAIRHLRALVPCDFSYKEYSNAEAALKPLLWIFGIIAVTVGLAFFADFLADDNERRRLRGWGILVYHTLRFLGPWGVAALGFLPVVGCIVWLCMRVGTPPIAVTLTPEEPGGTDSEEEED